MTVTITTAPHLPDTRRAFVLAEDRVGHYPEFRAALVRLFDLDRVGLAAPGYVRAPSGLVYEWVFLGRSGEAFPSGVEIYALPPALEPLDDAATDRDILALLSWLMGETGPPWSAEILRETARLYRVPAAMG